MTDRKDDRLWGGRFENAPDADFDAFQRSFSFDSRFLPYQLSVDRAWARGLRGAEVLTEDELRQILAALDEIGLRVRSDPAWVERFGAEVEDVHHFAEKAVVDAPWPGWLETLHRPQPQRTGRNGISHVCRRFRQADAHSAFTSSPRVYRSGQEVHPHSHGRHDPHAVRPADSSLTFPAWPMPKHFSATASGFRDAIDSADYCPMGSGALAGCAFPVDRLAIARELGFSRITANSLDAVSDRDFALDYLFALSTIATHLSRLAEDFVIFASQPFSYVLLSDEYSTGSSLMPQKKNPDSWELIRGKTGRVTSSLLTLLTVLKGLPSSYQRDLQEDKESLFLAHDQVQGMLMVAAGALNTTRFREDRLRRLPRIRPCLQQKLPIISFAPAPRSVKLTTLWVSCFAKRKDKGVPWTKLTAVMPVRSLRCLIRNFLPSSANRRIGDCLQGGRRRHLPKNSVRSSIDQFEQKTSKGGDQRAMSLN